METDLKTVAETRRCLLQEGLIPLEGVRSWADNLIMDLAVPPYWLIAVSMARSSEEAGTALGEVAGTANTVAVWRALLKAWLDLLEKDPERDSDIAKRLYYMGMEGRSPVEGLDGELISFWDAIDLARDGVYGCREAERDNLRNFLARCYSEAD